MERTKRANPTNGNESRFPLQSVIGGLIGFGVTVVLLLALPFLVLGFEDPNSFVLPSVCLCTFIGNAVGGFVSASKGNNMIVATLISLGTAILPIILISFFVSGGFSLVSVVAVLLSATVGNVLSAFAVTKFSKSKKRKMKSVMKRR